MQKALSTFCYVPEEDLASPKGAGIFPGSIAKGSSSKSGCQLHLPTSHANLSRVTSPANFSCQLVESYFTCQLLMPTCRELLHLPTSHVNFLRVTSPANFSCQLFGCYLILLGATARALRHARSPQRGAFRKLPSGLPPP